MSVAITICFYRRYLQKSGDKPSEKSFSRVKNQGLRLT